MDLSISLLRKYVEEVLKDKEIKGDYPMVSVSQTNFGTSFYIQNQNEKIRISDHSVSNADRIFGEHHFSLKNFSAEELKQTIKELFSEDYFDIGFWNGLNFVNFKKKDLKFQKKNWVSCKVFFREVTEEAISISDIDIKKYEILQMGRLTKKKDKVFCKILKTKCRFGAMNIATGEVLCTNFYVAENSNIDNEICLI
ncbi:hypothetical protein [Riemerella anatipestifer]|uniref:hypothetical protein n=1 Tax=Riemerella anatipestifer TaxID=34085 RepID=UPI00129D488C|nr:hypothetical protein [Riemerella anatipestifer]MRM84294.1 hypothetical protein [Riemerella anatipestifer]